LLCYKTQGDGKLRLLASALGFHILPFQGNSLREEEVSRTRGQFSAIEIPEELNEEFTSELFLIY